MKTLEVVRIRVPEDEIFRQGRAEDFFDIRENTGGITEEFLYSHQPVTRDVLRIYSTSEFPVGALDSNKIPHEFSIVHGPAIVVARKGYAGRMFVVSDPRFIVHEDAYPIAPKKEYADKIDLWWFAGHYSAAFQADRTSFWGIGDFPRERFRNQKVVIPRFDFQLRTSMLYRRRAAILNRINGFKNEFHASMSEAIDSLLR